MGCVSSMAFDMATSGLYGKSHGNQKYGNAHGNVYFYGNLHGTLMVLSASMDCSVKRTRFLLHKTQSISRGVFDVDALSNTVLCNRCSYSLIN